jgi:hypothetical protein
VKITIAFYKGRGDFVNAIVRWWTKSIYSHAELILPDEITWISISPSFKSKIMRRIILEVECSEWDFIEIEVTPEQHNVILAFFEETEGQGYDWIGMLLSQFLPCKIKHRERWYCSEWIAYALRIACVFDWRKMKMYDRQDLSPAALHDLIKNFQN